MSTFSINENPFGMILFFFPILIFVVSMLLQIAAKKKLIITSVVFIGCLIATFTVFNSSFLIWCFVYTVISYIGTFVGDLIVKFYKNMSA